MNLNPLKKDDNTDALVKALEDANNAEQTASDNSAPDFNNPVSVDDTAAQIANDPALGAMPPAQDDDQADQAEASVLAEAASPLTNTDLVDSNLPTVSDLPSGITSDADAHVDSLTSGSTDVELDTVKKSALEQLRPLIEKIDLEPSDKFDKYLMMLRASDDPTLIKPAFEAAESISGEKEKAQALLDIINEINYITSNQTPAS